MMSIDWTDDLAIGIPEIDLQHQELFRRFNNLLAAFGSGTEREEVIPLLDFLSEYVVRHFAEEEQLQEEYGYPGLEGHRLLHETFVANLNALRAQVAVEGVSLSLVLRTNSALIDWLINHIGFEDRKIGLHIRSAVG